VETARWAVCPAGPSLGRDVPAERLCSRWLRT